MLKDRGHVDDLDLIDADAQLLAEQQRIVELEKEVAQLGEALGNRQRYGVVTGVLAERYRIPPERAWQLVVRLSQQSNLKVQVIARVMHGRFFGRLTPEDHVLADRLEAMLGSQIRPVVLATGAKQVRGEQG